MRVTRQTVRIMAMMRIMRMTLGTVVFRSSYLAAKVDHKNALNLITTA